MDRNTGFAQYGLRNAGELVRIGPSLGMADLKLNSANACGAGTRLLSLTEDSGARRREDWCYL